MSIELITGRAGKPHVDSQDVRAYQAYTAGSGRYVLHGAACSVESANQVSIAPGEILVDGAHVRVTGDGEAVTLANGQTGYKRADIVALHYTVTGSGESIVEHMEFTVVQGSPSDTDPTDPDMPQSGSILDGVTETYIPYARVVIDGLSPQDPVALLDDYALPSGIGGVPSGGAAGQTLVKASAVDYDTEWVKQWLAQNSSGEVELDWTTGGLGGRVYKTVWEGSWSSGSITVPEAKYYNGFIFSFSNNDSNNWSSPAEFTPSDKTTSSRRFYPFFHTKPDNSGQLIYVGAVVNLAGDTFTLTSITGVKVLSDVFSVTSTQPSRIVKIIGIL